MRNALRVQEVTRRRGRLMGVRRLRKLAAVLASAAIVLTGLVFAPAASAAGNGVLSVSLTPVQALTGAPITETRYDPSAVPGANAISYRVAYSCSVANCDGATVTFSPSQPDPYGIIGSPPANYGPRTLLTYMTWTRPNEIPESTPSGDDATGMTFSLGDLAAGASGTFLATYNIPETGTYTSARAAQFYPDGFQIRMSATIDSATAVAPVSAGAAPVTWRIKTPEPDVVLAHPDVVRPDETTSSVGYMSSGSFPRRDASSITGTSEWIAAGNFTVVQHLPEQAQVAGAIPRGGVYDPAAHTITWTRGTEADPVYGAAGGWGKASGTGWVARDDYTGHRVYLAFPAENFPAADANGCNFEAVLPMRIETTVTYLDDARTTKTASSDSEITVACWDPFLASALAKDSSGSASSGSIRLLNVPNPGEAANAYRWEVTASNGGNVPAVAVIDEDLSHADLPVNRIDVSIRSTIDWELNTGDTGTATNAASITAPAGTWYTSAKVTSGEIAPVRIRPTDTGWAPFRVSYFYTVSDTAPHGEQRTNTATAVMSWPGNPGLAPEAKTSSRTVQFRATPGLTPRLTAAFPSAAVVDGGGQAIPDRNVTFSVNGSTLNIPAGSSFSPEYVFIAPVGWKLIADSAAFTGDVPEGVTFSYATRSIGGVDRDVVVASWPTGATFADVSTLPTMSVTSKPTFAVAAGTLSQAEVRIGDTARNWTNTEAVYGGAKQNADDADGSGDLTAWFTTSVQAVPVSSTSALSVIKEICLPDADAADGCAWTADSSRPAQVPTDAASIEYRITLQNTGNTSLGDVVAYDVLPHPGDTGLIPSTEGTPRGSTFDEVLEAVSEVSGNVTLTYSGSTDPVRPEVHPGAGGVDDWGVDPVGKRALRAEVPDGLAPGEIATFQYAAAVVAGADADALACNSVATVTDRTLASEPRPVCAITAEADLEATGPATIPAQRDRPAVFPFTFHNNGGSQSAEAEVSITVPAGVTVTDLTPNGWVCTSVDGGAPLPGPTSLSCLPDAELEKGSPMALDLVTVVTGAGVAVTARIDGTVTDTDPSNNEQTITADVAPAAQEMSVSKSDGLAGVVPGQQTTYTITVTNPLRTEVLPSTTIVDTLPAGLQFVSASHGGAFADGSVTWSVADIAAGGSAEVTVTALVLDDAPNEVTNSVTVTAADPVSTEAEFTGTATDVDAVNRLALTKTATVVNPSASRPGDVVTFTLIATNTGGGVLSGVALTDTMDGLSAITVESWPTLPGYLGAGDSITAHAEYTLTQADVDAGTISNSATAAADTVDGETVTAAAGVDVTLPAAPALVLTKDGAIAGDGVPRAGDEIIYTFTVANSGNMTVSDIDLVDGMSGLSAISFGAWPGAEGVLGAGQSVTATATYALTQSDIDDGRVDNTANVSGVDPSGEAVTAEASDTVIPPAAPELTAAKTGTLEDVDVVEAGTVITYEFVIRNTGNVTITDVTLDDPLPGLSVITYAGWPGAEGALAPGESVRAAAMLVLTQDHVDAGAVENTATASGTPARGELADAVAENTVTIEVAPSLVVVKHGELADVDGDLMANPGEKIVFSFDVYNTGNVTMSDVAVADEMVTGVPVIDSLAPGESVTVTASEYVVTVEDAAAGEVLNTATVNGVTPAGVVVSSEPDSVRVLAVAAPAVEPGDEGLAATGVDPTAPLWLGGSLLVAGAGLLLLIAAWRRRRAAAE